MKTSRRSPTECSCRAVAFCGIMAGISIAVMLIIGAVSTEILAAPLYAASFLLIVRTEFGRKAAWCTWSVVTAVTLLLCLSKRSVVSYLFLAWWPIVKYSIDYHLKWIGIRFPVKILILVPAISAMYGMMTLLTGFQSDVTQWVNLSLVLLTLVAMLIYDFLLRAMLVMYKKRIRKRLRFLVQR